MRVECNDCRSARIVRPEDNDLPGEVLSKNGKAKGHKLRIISIAEDRDPLTP